MVLTILKSLKLKTKESSPRTQALSWLSFSIFFSLEKEKWQLLLG
jgi:hypothetical protein